MALQGNLLEIKLGLVKALEKRESKALCGHTNKYYMHPLFLCLMFYIDQK